MYDLEMEIGFPPASGYQKLIVVFHWRKPVTA
jgi:hypothetical protein